jgi:hypothetical protein
LKFEYPAPELEEQYSDLESVPDHRQRHIAMMLIQEFSTQYSASQHLDRMDDTSKTFWDVTLAADPTLPSFVWGPSK